MTSEAPTGRRERARVDVRPATAGDLARINEIYNHYVRESPATFDLEEASLAEREAWFERYAATGPYRLFVAERAGVVVGYAYSYKFRDRAAYESTIETSVYCAPEATGRGVGTALYEALFAAIAGAGRHVAIAGVTLPNDASIALHERFGFELAGIMREVGRKFGRYWDVAWFQKPLE